MSFINKIIRTVSRIKYRSQVIITNKNLSQITYRNFSYNSRLCNKMFMEHENKYAYEIMRSKGFAIDIEMTESCSLLNKEQFENLLAQDWYKCSPTEIFQAFPKFGAYCKKNDMCISNTIFDTYVDILTDNLKCASDQELINLFYAFNIWPETLSIRTRNFIEVWVALDDVCFSRLNRFTLDEILLFISLFYMLNVSRVSDFPKKSLEKLASKAKKLTPEQLIKTLFFVGIQRSAPHNIHNLEVHLEHSFSLYSVDDLAIISMGFFKSKTPIRRIDLVKQIMEEVIVKSTVIHEMTLAALLKIIRYSMRTHNDEATSMIYNLLDSLQHETSRLSVMCNVHIALLGSSKLVLHEGCLDSIAISIAKNMSQTRSKDLERLVLSYGTLRYKPKLVENFFDSILYELRKPEREDEIHKHGRSYACCVQYLGLFGIYPIDIMDKILDRKFLHNTYGKQCHGYGKEVLIVNNIAAMFCSKHQINRLTDKETIILSKKYTDFVPSKDFKKQYNITERMMLDIMDVLTKIRGGDEFVIADHILTHHQRGDIILCSNLEGSPLPVTDHFKSNTFGLLRRPPDDNKWVVLVVAGQNGVIHGTLTPTGPFHIKIKELRYLGYHANLVLWSIYSELQTFEEKEQYLLKCIDESVQNNH